MTLKKKLYSVNKVIDFIKQGLVMSLAGDAKILDKLPSGNWIAGSTPYFMDADGGKFNQKLIFVTQLNVYDNDFKIDFYDEHNIDEIVQDSFENGYTILIIPSSKKLLEAYAISTENMVGLYNNPIVGWVSGVDLYSEDDDVSKTYYGPNGKTYEHLAVAIHVKLPKKLFAQIDIINIFSSNLASDKIQFYKDGFDVTNCKVNGEDVVFSEYIEKNGIDTTLPLSANYNGISINVSIKEIMNGSVSFFAPVFNSKIYRFSNAIPNYMDEFEKRTNKLKVEYEFSCNCVLNYLYGGLEGKKINNVKGPFTFGEIGYTLLNQTLVNLEISEVK